MPIQIMRNDITKVTCDAIVNAANTSLLGGGGVDGAIHRAAGKGLLLECIKLGGCRVGQAKITGAYRLPCKYIIHTVGPRWHGGQRGEKELLESCYRESLKLARENHCESVAFPLISSGAYGYPKAQALRVAMDVISEFLADNDMQVYIVVFDREAFQISSKLFDDIQEYIDHTYVEQHTNTNLERMRSARVGVCEDDIWEEEEQILFPDVRKEDTAYVPLSKPTEPAMPYAAAAPSLSEALKEIDESFAQMLLRKIDEKGLTDAQCYKKANVDRKLFSKIRSNTQYKPSKATAIAFAIALELSLEETKDMLMKAGYALSHSNKFDIIIEYFIQNRNYNIFQINEVLFAFDQSLLGV